jgi:hypothetical protein
LKLTDEVLNELAQEVLSNSKDWFNEGKRWIQKKWYSDTRIIYRGQFEDIIEDIWSYGNSRNTEHENRHEHAYIASHTTVKGCLVGGIDHNIWLTATEKKLTRAETLHLSNFVYDHLVDTLMEQFPEFYRDKRFNSTMQRVWMWNDWDSRKWSEVELILDKAARGL